MRFFRMGIDKKGKQLMGKIWKFLGWITPASCVLLLAAVSSAYAVTVDPTSKDFEGVKVGTSSEAQAFTITNDEGAALEVTSITLEGTDLGEFAIGDNPVSSLPDGETGVVKVSFAPTSAGAKTATLNISFDAADALVIDLSGTGTLPQISITPDSWNAGDRIEGTTGWSETFTVANDGEAPLEVTATTIDGDDEFVIDSGGEPFTVAPGSPEQIVVNFNPGVTPDSPTSMPPTGPKSAVLIIENDDPDEADKTIEVVLEGHVISPEDRLPSYPIDIGHQDFAYGSQVYDLPTAEKPQSKLWWTDDSWWGVLWDPVNGEYRIHRFDADPTDWNWGRWVNEGIAADNRPLTLADALWDEGEQKLYILSHVADDLDATPDDAKIFRYSYNSSTSAYSLDDGFPVLLDEPDRTESAALAKDSNGKLWMTWESGRSIWVNRSTTDDANWGTPFELPGQPSDEVSSDDISAIVAFGDATDGYKIGIMWSDQRAAKFYFAVHNDNDPDMTWLPAEEALAVDGKDIANDHISMKAFEGKVYAMVMTLLWYPSDADPNDPNMYVLKRESDGSWTNSLYGVVDDFHERPLMMINEGARVLYAIAVGEEAVKGTIYMKSSGLDNIIFPEGLGAEFLKSQLSDETTINYPTSTKQNINSTTGLLVAASNKEVLHYFHRHISGADLPDLLPAVNLDVTPVSWDYEDVIEGLSGSKTFTIENSGASAASLNVTITGADAAEFSHNISGGVLAVSSGANETVEVTFSPTSPGAKSAVLSLSIDGYHGSIDVALTGNATAALPDISVAPTSGDYGEIEVGLNSSSQTFTVENAATATGDLEVDAPALTGDDAGDFEIVSGGAAFTLAPGETQDIEVRFTPASVGAKSAVLRITSNDADNPTLDVTLSGTGITPEDNDGDGMPDSWEQQIIDADPEDDIADKYDVDPDDDYDKDGLTNLEEFQKGDGISSPINARPDAPTLFAPADLAVDVLLTPQLETLDFVDETDAHYMTHWQVSTDSTFQDDNQLVLDVFTDTYLTLMYMPDLVLELDTQYFWRAAFIDSADQTSAWADPDSFDTVDTNQNDLSEPFGVPDDQEADCAELFGEGAVPANTTCLYGVVGDAMLGIEGSTNVASIESFMSKDPADMPENLPGVNLILGLMTFKAQCNNVGDTIEVIFHSSEPIPAKAKLWKWDPANGWYPYPDSAYSISPDGKSIEVEYIDGGLGDLDKIANGWVIDPAGFGVATGGGGGGGGGGGCFITASKDGASAADKMPALILILGIGLFALVELNRRQE